MLTDSGCSPANPPHSIPNPRPKCGGRKNVEKTGSGSYPPRVRANFGHDQGLVFRNGAGKRVVLIWKSLARPPLPPPRQASCMMCNAAMYAVPPLNPEGQKNLPGANIGKRKERGGTPADLTARHFPGVANTRCPVSAFSFYPVMETPPTPPPPPPPPASA